MSDFKNTQDFRKSKLSKHAYQDPTYLSFTMMFDFTDAANSPLLSKPAENFLRKLTTGDNNESSEFYKERLEALINFKKALKTINIEMPWYWQGISGLEKIQQYNPENAYMGGDDAVLTIETLESLNLPITGLMHLYRKAVFDERKWTYILPSNLRKFRMYIYVTEVRTIKNMSKPKINGFNKEALRGFPDNFKPSINIENSNEGISGTANRPYFMFGLKYCEFDMTSGTGSFADLKKSPEESASGEISITYEKLYSLEARALNGIITSEFGNDNISPAPDSESGGPDTLAEWAIDKAIGAGKQFADRAITDLKTMANNKVGELKQQAKDATIGRLNVAVQNAYKNFVNGVDDAASVPNQTTNISAAISENVHGGLIQPGNTIVETLNNASARSLGNVHE
jgi:hypothetical protein